MSRKVKYLNDSPQFHMTCINNKKVQTKSMNIAVSSVLDIKCFSERFSTELCPLTLGIFPVFPAYITETYQNVNR